MQQGFAVVQYLPQRPESFHINGAQKNLSHRRRDGLYLSQNQCSNFVTMPEFNQRCL